MSIALPPSAALPRLALELRFVRSAERDDAAQEAWVAHLEGRDPAKAVSNFRHRERRRRIREIAVGGPLEQHRSV